jgi:uncharacterized protein (TIGR00251 family)
MILTVKVTPRARKNAIISYEDSVLKVRLHAIPEKGRANAELIAFLADTFDLPKSSFTLLRGNTSRIKHLNIEGLDEAHLCKILKKDCP